MPTVLKILADVIRRLTGPGAVDNAALEMDRALRSVVDVDAQLHRTADPLPRRAA